MKYINELTDNEKRALIENNSALANMVYDDMIENEMYFITEQLDYIRDGLRDYSIGAYNRNIIIVSDAVEFFARAGSITKKLLYFTGRHARRNRTRFIST